MEDLNGFIMSKKSSEFGVVTSSSSLSRRRRRRRVYDNNNNNNNNNNSEEFEEEDVLWKETEYSPQRQYGYEEEYSRHVINKLPISSGSSSSPGQNPKRPHNINNNNNNNIQENETKKVVHHRKQSSAAMKIPDWSKIYGSWGNNNISSKYDELDHDPDHGHGDGDDVMVPPHEWIARNLARTQISSFSVCEGIGRTLKGRDLSKVRNAVLTKTGFLE